VFSRKKVPNKEIRRSEARVLLRQRRKRKFRVEAAKIKLIKSFVIWISGGAASKTKPQSDLGRALGIPAKAGIEIVSPQLFQVAQT
jgi:hypothetical protein